MTADAFVEVDDKKVSVEELQQMLSDAFHAGCDLGFKEGLEGAKSEAHSQHCEGCEKAIDEICGPNVFAVMAGFDKWVKTKGGKT